MVAGEAPGPARRDHDSSKSERASATVAIVDFVDLPLRRRV